MTIRVKIGTVEKDISEVDPSWVNQQINGGRADGDTVCVQVTIDKGSVRLHLATSDCPSSGGSHRPLNSQEKEIWSLWKKLRLDDKHYTGGNLVAFLNQIQ